MKRTTVALIVLAAAAVVAAYSACYTVGQQQQAVVTQFGEIVGKAVTDPGLHFKIPFIQKVTKFDKRWLEWDGDPTRIPTLEKKYIWVDSYARWRIADPIRFYERVHDEMSAQSRLDDILDGDIRDVISNHQLLEVVRSTSRPFKQTDEEKGIENPADFKVKIGRGAIMKEVLAESEKAMPELGIELNDVRIKRINYTKDVRAKVYDRMISERKRIAAKYRSEGEGARADKMGQIDKNLKKIQSNAYRQAEEIRGKADAQAAAIYAAAYSKDPELYRFLKTLDTYRKTIDKNTTVVLSTDAQVFKLLKTDRPTK